MRKEIELNDQYLMILTVNYIKNVSTNGRYYEIESKIVQKEKYSEDKEDYGEIEGEYFKKIYVNNSKNSFINNLYKKSLQKNINRTINRFFSRSRDLVKEWEQNKGIMKETEAFIQQMGI